MRAMLTMFLAVVVVLAGILGYNWLQYIHIYGVTEGVAFASGDGVKFEGTLFKPDTSGPHPVIILLHGSGKASGTPPFVTAHANSFLKKGIAVFVYDKRGSGKSGGDFDSATFADFINDAIASIEAMRARDDINGDKIGVFGSSESGWFTPEIAERAGQISLIINRAGPPLTWIETNLWEIRNELIAAGLSNEAETAEFLELREDIWHYYKRAALAHDPLVEIRAALEARHAKIDPRWLEVTGMNVGAYEQEKFERWIVDIFYDPAEYLERMEAPLYALFASDDQNVPTAAAVKVIERLVRDNNKYIKLVVFPGYPHGMYKWRNIFWAGYPPSYLTGIAQWADERFGEGGSVSGV